MSARLSASHEHAGEMLDGVGVVVCSVLGGIGGVPWYPVRGLMGLGYGGYVLEVCVVSAEVTNTWSRYPHLKGPDQRAKNTSPQLNGTHRSVGVYFPSSRGHIKIWKSSTQTERPKQSLQLHHLDSRGHNKA